MKEKKVKEPVFSLIASYAAELTLCGVIGWVYEVTLMYVMWHEFSDRGILHIPVLPIYMVFSVILLLMFRKRNGAVFVFVASTAVTTAGELISSYIIEAALHEQLWTYRMWKYNFQGRIALYSSLIFGALGVLLVKVVHPLMRLFYKKAPRASAAVGVVCAATVIGDILLTLWERAR